MKARTNTPALTSDRNKIHYVKLYVNIKKGIIKRKRQMFSLVFSGLQPPYNSETTNTSAKYNHLGQKVWSQNLANLQFFKKFKNNNIFVVIF